MFIFMPVRRDSIIVIGLGLSLALAATALAQDGLISTARKSTTPEAKTISKATEDLLAPLPGTGVIIDRTKDALVPIEVKLGGAPASATATPDPKARRPGMKISSAEAEPEAVAAEAKAPPPSTVGRTKANPLCLVEGVLIACGSTPPSKDKSKR